MNSVKCNPSQISSTEPVLPGYVNNLKSRQIWISTSISILFVITFYIWFISFGSWTNWPSVTNYDGYYNELAIAFQGGNLSLQIKPSPDLLALQDPYDPTSRHDNHIAYPIDFSLYKGKYYLYFGPVPALFLLAVRLMGSGTIADHYFVFIFVSGILIFQSLLIIKIRKRFFKNIPAWLTFLCILFCGLISPIPWILTLAQVYEAASAGGQFFFLAGLYFLINALDRESPSIGQLLVTGISWAFAIGTRLTQIVPIGFVIFMTIFWILRIFFQTKRRSRVSSPLIALCLPIVFGLAILGWYNWARFDSVFETGFYYELAGPFLQKYSHVLFSPLYLLPNLWDYLVVRPKVGLAFPFIQSISGYGSIKFSFISLPPIYHEGSITGILFSTPFVLFAAIPLLTFLPKNKTTSDEIVADHDTYLFKWLIISLLGSFLFGLAPLVLYFFVQTRFLTDFISSLILLSVIGFWQGYNFLTYKPFIRRLYVAAGILLMGVSIIISILVTLSANAAQFQQFNPILWNHLISLFSR
ncbi:MAG TPA: hypothetical protein VIN60_03525 [Anaerolineales bacterium]